MRVYGFNGVVLCGLAMSPVCDLFRARVELADGDVWGCDLKKKQLINACLNHLLVPKRSYAVVVAVGCVFRARHGW